MKKYLWLFGMMLTLLAALSFGTLIGCGGGGGGDDDDDDDEFVELAPDFTDMTQIKFGATINEQKGYITQGEYLAIKDAPAGSYLKITFDFSKVVPGDQDSGWGAGTWGVDWGAFGKFGLMEGDNAYIPEDSKENKPEVDGYHYENWIIELTPALAGIPDLDDSNKAAVYAAFFKDGLEIKLPIADVRACDGVGGFRYYFVNIWAGNDTGTNTDFGLIKKVELFKSDDTAITAPVVGADKVYTGTIGADTWNMDQLSISNANMLEILGTTAGTHDDYYLKVGVDISTASANSLSIFDSTVASLGDISFWDETITPNATGGKLTFTLDDVVLDAAAKKVYIYFALDDIIDAFVDNPLGDSSGLTVQAASVQFYGNAMADGSTRDGTTGVATGDLSKIKFETKVTLWNDWD